MNLPNFLTLLRVLLVPVFATVYYLPFAKANLIAALIFGAAAVTDYIDGYLARHWKQTSEIGAFLDPVADKLLVVVALLMVVFDAKQIWMVLVASIIISREIIVSALREWMAILGKSVKLRVKQIAKVKTFAQMLALFLLLMSSSAQSSYIYQCGWFLLLVSSVLTVWSFFCYLKVIKTDLTLS